MPARTISAIASSTRSWPASRRAARRARCARPASLIVDAVSWPVTDLRVDWHGEPIHELAGLWHVWKPQERDYVVRAVDPTRAPGYGVPGDE